jgi:hypothetical protein
LTFTWRLPYQPADSAALERMRQHFHKPSELMPFAWFMSEIEYMTWLMENPPESFSAKELSLAIREIGSGLKNFPGAYDEVWSDWLKYLLPYTLQIMNSEKDDSWDPGLLEGTFNAIIYVFPQGITEAYHGFRDDLVYTFGTRLFPQVLSRDNPAPISASLKNPVFNDFWDYTNSPGMEKPGLYTEFYYPMCFCLKYLNRAEIETWLESLLKIESPQWYLSIMTWCLYKDDEAPVTTLISESQLKVFYDALSQQLTRDHFHKWMAEIRRHQTFEYSEGTFPIADDLKQSIEQTFGDFEKAFFPPLN